MDLMGITMPLAPPMTGNGEHTNYGDFFGTTHVVHPSHGGKANTLLATWLEVSIWLNSRAMK